MNEQTPLQTWVDSLIALAASMGLKTRTENIGTHGHAHGFLHLSRPDFDREYIIKFLSERAPGTNPERRFYIKIQHPTAKRAISLKRFTQDNLVMAVQYAMTALSDWKSVTQREHERRKRKLAGEKLAIEQEISDQHVPAWAIVSPNVEQPEDAGTFRLSFRAYDVGYPLKRLTPEQVKRVIHFLKFIDKPAAPSCTCDCLPCQSCDHR